MTIQSINMKSKPIFSNINRWFDHTANRPGKRFSARPIGMGNHDYWIDFWHRLGLYLPVISEVAKGVKSIEC